MSELEKGLKEQLEMVIKDNQRLLEKHFKQDSELVKLIEEKEYYKFQLQQKENIIKEIKSQLDYLETYSSKEDVFEDMKRRLDKIEKIIDKENEDDK